MNINISRGSLHAPVPKYLFTLRLTAPTASSRECHVLSHLSTRNGDVIGVRYIACYSCVDHVSGFLTTAYCRLTCIHKEC